MSKISEYSIIGVMSGTSLDGLDIVKCTFKKHENWNYKINKGITIKYSEKWINILKKLHTKPISEVKKTSILYGKLIGDEVRKFADKNNFKYDFVCSHGHTIFHQPKNNFTLQIGDGQAIANKTNKLTISNFRELDVQLNGQGAPLVPIGDLHLFNEYKYCLNLGGFANISIKQKNQIKAFDICPANIILNHISRKLGLEYDNNGNIGRQGHCNKELLEKLNNITFYKQKEPKSLSREWLEKNILSLKEIQLLSAKDLLATFYEHIGFQIGRLLIDNSVLISGGGAHNSFLCEKIKENSTSQIIIAENHIIDFKEALIFGFLGVLRIREENNCLKEVTGALKDSCGGEINLPFLTN